MPTHNPRIDAYISKSAEFAKPVLEHLRDIIHKHCPDVQETIKWSFPHFEYQESILCSMASFKQHCSFGFWLGSLMKDPHNLLTPVGERTAMGHFGQIKSVKDLPSDKILASYIKEAMALIEIGTKLPKAPKAEPKDIVAPPYFLKELKKNKTAYTNFESFSPSHKKEYLEWITDAKTEATRNKRMAAAIEMLEEGKPKNWKYMR
jgi:uncharacterized protein YdeI (YjbR/CyaY-like superfamily)